MTNHANTPHGRSYSPPCPAYKKCGGCQLQNMSYPDHLHWKEAQVIRNPGSFCHVSPILGMSEPTHYRNKVQTLLAPGRGGVISGVYQSVSQRIATVKSCMLEDKAAFPIIETIKKLMVSLYYRVVVIRVPLQGMCYTVRDAVDWFVSPTAIRFMWNKVTRVYPLWCIWTRKRPICTFLLSRLQRMGSSAPRKSWAIRKN